MKIKKIYLYSFSYMRLIMSLVKSLIVDKKDKVIYKFEKIIPKLVHEWEKLKIE